MKSRCLHSFLVVLVFLVLLPSPARSQSLAEWSYKLFNEDCSQNQKTTLVQKQTVKENPVCAKEGTTESVTRMITSLGEVAENSYLAKLAEIRVRQLECSEKQILHLKNSPADFEKFVNDYQAKLVLLGTEKKKMASLLPSVGRDKAATEEYKKSRLRAEAILASLPYTEIDSIQKLIRYSVSQYEAGENLSVKGPFADQNKKMIRQAIIGSLDLINKNQDNLRKGINTSGTSFDQSTKESLAQDTHLVETFRNSNPKLINQIKPVACSVDAKYGKGAQYADNIILAATVLGPGIAAGLTKISATAVVSSLRGAAAMGAVSARSAGVFRVLSYAGGVEGGIQQIYKACTGNEISLKTQKGENEALSCNGNIVASLESENCVLVSAMNALGAQQAYKTVPEALSLITKGNSLPKVEIGSAISGEIRQGSLSSRGNLPSSSALRRWQSVGTGKPPKNVPYMALGVAENLKEFSAKTEKAFDHPVIDFGDSVFTPANRRTPERNEIVEKMRKQFGMEKYLEQIKYIASQSPNEKNILMNLDGVDIEQFKGFVKGISSNGGNHTNKEIQLILSDPYLFEHTRWYRNGKELDFQTLFEEFHDLYPDRFK
jgi:hypothetical protein